MSKPWFDSRTGLLLLDEYVAETPSFQTIMADGIVTQEELAEQGQRVVSLLKDLEVKLTPNLKDLATRVLVELAVLHALQAYHSMKVR